MDHVYRIDHLIGLIYESIPSPGTVSYVVEAISTEVEVCAGRGELAETDRRALRDYVSRAVHRYADLPEGDMGLRTGDSAVFFRGGPSGGLISLADEFLLRLSSHLARSAIWRNRLHQLEAQQRLRQIELDQLAIGLVWVGPNQQIAAQNLAAEMHLQGDHGLCVRDGRLCASSNLDEYRLSLALMSALRQPEPESSVLAFRGRHTALPLLLVCVRAVTLSSSMDGVGSEPRALLLMHQRQDLKGIRLSHLQSAYRFTAAEIRLAEAIANNETLDDYAVRCGISGTTVRSHLSQLFKKTGTSRQAELVRLLVLGRALT